MKDREHKERIFKALLKVPGYVGEVARRLVELARDDGTARRCVYCDIELCATHQTQPEDLERVFSAKSIASRLRGSSGILALQ